MTSDEEQSDAIFEVPIDGVLDLHTFHPQDVKLLIPEYLLQCQSRDILTVRIIHGKGTGALRERVHAILRKLPQIREFYLAPDGSSWGATIVELFENHDCGEGDSK